MFGLQPWHIIVIVLVALLIFGPKRLPEMGRNIGKMISELRNGSREVTDSLRESMNQPTNTAPSNPIPGNVIRPVESSVPFQTNTIRPAPGGNYCIMCGSGNTPEAKFCNQCGSKLPDKIG